MASSSLLNKLYQACYPKCHTNGQQQQVQISAISELGMYQISGWPDIRPFFAIRFRIRPKYCLAPDSATG